MSDTHNEPVAATQEQWDFAHHHIGTEILPAVSRQTGFRLHKNISEGTLLNKTPSFVSSGGVVIRKAGWPEFHATAQDVKEWRSHPEHNILINNRVIRCLDIDIDNPEYASKIHYMAVKALGFEMNQIPARGRSNVGRVSLFFKVYPNPPMLHRAVKTSEGAIEFRADKCQSLWAGRHESGVLMTHQYIENGFPTVDLDKLEAFWDQLRAMFDPDSPPLRLSSEEQVRVYGSRNGGVQNDDPVAQYIHEQGYALSVQASGAINVECPSAATHTTFGESSTTFFPSGLAGIHTPGFRCLHTKCKHITNTTFLEHIGYSAKQRDKVFAVDLAPNPVVHAKEVIQAEAQRYVLVSPKVQEAMDLAVRNAEVIKPALTDLNLHVKTRKVLNTIHNLTTYLLQPEIVHAKFDSFQSEAVVRLGGTGEYKNVTDTLVSTVRLTLERISGITFGHQEVSRALSLVSAINEYDSAQEWIGQQQWDGVPRLERFALDVLKAHDSPYARALSQYLFIAVAGRILQPGCKADISPVLISLNQGTGKSSLVSRLAPFPDWFGTVDFTNEDDDIFRAIRGKVVLELPELRGLFGRDAAATKALLTQQVDTWTPKYMEYQIEVPRRCIFVGTDNRSRFLTDASGNRRWSPIHIAQTAKYIDWPTFQNHTAQYYAEAAHILKEYRTPEMGVGVYAAKLGYLARDAVEAATILDAWHDMVASFVAIQPPGSVVTLTNVFSQLFNAGAAAMDNARVYRMRNIMTMLRLEAVGADKWRVPVL